MLRVLRMARTTGRPECHCPGRNPATIEKFSQVQSEFGGTFGNGRDEHVPLKFLIRRQREQMGMVTIEKLRRQRTQNIQVSLSLRCTAARSAESAGEGHESSE